MFRTAQPVRTPPVSDPGTGLPGPVGGSGRDRALFLLVSLLAGAVFLPALLGGWIYDDRPLIADNPYAQSFIWFTRWFTTDFWSVGEEMLNSASRIVYWRPLVTLTYALDWNLGGGSPLMFHVTNTIAHAAVGGLSFLLLRRWIGGGAAWPAVLAALLFALHPTKAESVAWISGRTDILCTLAIFLASAGFARRLRGLPWGLPLELGGTIMAYLSKEQAIILPAFVAVEAWVAAGRPGVDWNLVGRVLRAALPQTIVAMVYLAGRALWMPVRSGGDFSLPLADHGLAVLDSFGRFFELTFAPHELSIQQGILQRVDGQLLHSTGHVALGAAGLAILATLAVLFRRRRPAVTVGIAFYLATLLPTANLLFTGMQTLVSERFLYVPVLGVSLLLGDLLERQTPARRTLAFITAGAGVALFGLLAMLRAHDFSDEKRLWERELALHPESAEAHQQRIGRAMAERRYLKALSALLAFRNAMSDREFDIYRFGYQLADVGARLTPDLDRETLLALDRFTADLLDPRARRASLETTLATVELRKSAKDPGDLTLHQALLWTQRTTLALRLGDPVAAAAHLKRAHGACARCVQVTVAEAVLLAAEGDYDRAFAALGQDGREDPRIKAARNHLKQARDHRAMADSQEGPAALLARAAEFSELELWGRAYSLLAPHRDELAQIPEVAAGFAELAFRAGNFQVARDVLARTLPPPEIEARFRTWGDRMGWRN